MWTALKEIIGVLSALVPLGTAAYGLYRYLGNRSERVGNERRTLQGDATRPAGRDEDDGWHTEGESLPDISFRRPHRGQLISGLGFASFLFPFPLGPIAWFLGNQDLREMKAGRMDREGEAATRTGRLCGKVATIGFGTLFAISLVFSVIFLTIIGFVIRGFVK